MFSRQENEENARRGWSLHGDWLNRSSHFLPYWFSSYSDLYKRLPTITSRSSSGRFSRFWLLWLTPLCSALFRSPRFICVIPQFKVRVSGVLNSKAIEIKKTGGATFSLSCPFSKYGPGLSRCGECRIGLWGPVLSADVMTIIKCASHDWQKPQMETPILQFDPDPSFLFPGGSPDRITFPSVLKSFFPQQH